jgi:S-adenosylmethionine uptake transporter
MANSNLRGAALSLTAFGIYASHDVVVKFLGESYSPFQTIFFAGLLTFPLVSVVLMTDRVGGTLIPRHPGWSLLRTAMAVLNGLCGFYAFSMLPLAQCYAIFFAMPLLITLLAIPLLGEKIGLRRGLAVVVGLAGVVIVLRPADLDLNLGHLAALMAALTGATASVIVRKIGHAERSVVLMLYPMMGSFIAMALALPFVYRPMPVEHLGLLAVMAALSLTAGFLMILAYRAAPAVIVAPMQYSQILWAAVYGQLLFGEGIDLWTGIGAGVIIASGIYIVLREGTPAVSENRPVLETRSRFEGGVVPRIGLWMRIFDRKAGVE